ncbi:vWA domain-containing protein [Solirubrobacter soli]|uniref:vWA domain-containing protein n=1 Tax=Solirubrobacter soli TaxID=363832 RepID=UPI00069FD203|nr:VWA domain-containing protein [Solirubrobacter soli]
MLIIGLALAAVAIAFVASAGGDPKPPARTSSAPTPPTASPPPGALKLTLAYSPEKEALLAPLIKRFNAEGHKSAGRVVYIEPQIVASGDAETRISQGKLRPVLWSPASSFWGRLLNYEADRRLVADDNPSIVRTPLVIAMFKQLADAYGYPKRPLGYKELDKLATGGWAAVGKPQFGSFKYVHTNPDFSTAGLSAVAASYYAAVGKREGLTEADVTRGRPQVQRLEHSIVHYGDTTLFIADEMRRRGLGYASAAAMEETTMIDFNRHAGDGDHLVAIYPEEGTFFSDNPLMTLEGDWVTPEQASAGKVFTAFLAKAITPEVAGAQGFRPADPDVAPAGLVTAANGVDPKQPARVLRLPEPKVLAKIKATWREDRKPANVMMVFDNSGSMGEEDKLEQAKAGLKGFFRQAAPQDRIGLIKFSQDIVPLIPIAPMSANRAKLLAATDTILPEDDTRLRDATLAGINAVSAHLDRDAINAVVLLTDGEDTSSNHTASDVLQALDRQREKESGQIRVFTIAYGTDPNAEELAEYAKASGGKSYTGGADDIGSIYRSISSFF